MQSNFYEQRLTSLNKGVPNEEEKERACFRKTFQKLQSLNTT